MHICPRESVYTAKLESLQACMQGILFLHIWDGVDVAHTIKYASSTALYKLEKMLSILKWLSRHEGEKVKDGGKKEGGEKKRREKKRREGKKRKREKMRRKKKSHRGYPTVTLYSKANCLPPQGIELHVPLQISILMT